VNSTTQERIIDAAARLFSAKGYHQTSIDEIAEAAGVAKGSVYYNYKSKSALLVAVIRAGIDFVRGKVAAKTAPGAGPLRRLQLLIETAFDLMVQYHALVGFALSGACDGVELEAKEQIEAARKELEGDLASLLAEGAAAGELRPVPAGIAAPLFLGALERSVKVYADRAEKDHSAHEIRSALVTLLLEGVAARDGSPDARVLADIRARQ